MKTSSIITIACSLLITAGCFAQTPQEIKGLLPEIAGWKIDSKTEVFNRDNLYERINGAAPLFLENNVQEMTSMEYTKGGDYITIQAYRHASPLDAFGMYSSERSSEMDFYPIGGEAQGDNLGLFFFAGDLYVKMQTNNDTDENGEAMRKIAKAFANKIDPQASYPALFRFFPDFMQVPYSMSYITSNYIGHEFLKSVYTCDYDIFGKVLQGFVIDGKTKEGAQEILKQYFTFTKQTEDFREGELLIKDKFNGNIPCIWQGRYIVGIYDESGDDIDPEIVNYLSMLRIPE